MLEPTIPAAGVNMPSKIRLSAIQEADYGGALFQYFEGSDDAQKQLGFVLPPSMEDLKLLLPLGGAYKVVDTADKTGNIRGAIRVGSRPSKSSPKVNVRLILDDTRLIREIYPLIKKFAMSETKLIIEAYSVYGYEKEKIETLLDLGFKKGAATVSTACLDGRYYDTHYLYCDLEGDYQSSPRHKYAEEGDLYPLLPIEKQKLPSKLSFRLATPDDGGDLAESMSHQNTFRTLGGGMYTGCMTRSESASFIEQGKRSGLNHAIVCVDADKNKVIGMSDVEILPGHVSSHVGHVGIHVNARYQGLGVGTGLLKEIDLLSRRLHLQSLVLSYFENNEAGKRLYEKMDYEHRGEVPGWLASRYVKEIFMQKTL
jgi:RimJ/RimL family protein N-acetyltransferase